MNFVVSGCINTTVIIKVNCHTCNYLRYKYVTVRVFTVLADKHGKFILCDTFTQSVYVFMGLTRPCKIAVVDKCNFLSEYFDDAIN